MTNKKKKKATSDQKFHNIQKSVKRANSKNAKFIAHDKVTEWLLSWGNSNEFNAAIQWPDKL